MTFWKWSKTASSNANADSTINWAEGQSPSSVNDSARAMMAAAAKFRDDISGDLLTSGTATAYTVTSNQGFMALNDGLMIAFIPHARNTGAATLDVDGLGAKPLRATRGTTGALGAGSLVAFTPYSATYDTTNGEWILHGAPSLLPPGVMLPYGGYHGADRLLHLCGTAVSRTTYAGLFAAISTFYGVGDGSTTFNVPDLRGRVPAGVATGTTRLDSFGSLGAAIGSKEHTLTIAQMPQHNHAGTTASTTIIDPGHQHQYQIINGSFLQDNTRGAVRYLGSMSHAFAFGENWADFSASITRERVTAAEAGMAKLLPDLRGRTFLDIGCGSGLHSLAALNLGAAAVHAVDIDPASAETARRVLGSRVRVDCRSVFDLSAAEQADVIYSWGVLHHTGRMWDGIRHAAQLVKPGGLFAIAIYARTPLCGAWRLEKAAYSRAPRALQAIARAGFMGAYLAGLAATGRNPIAYVRDYREKRGMRWRNDVHDWMGGYPYESATFEEVASFLRSLELEEIRSFNVGRGIGIFGTGCNEFVYRRP